MAKHRNSHDNDLEHHLYGIMDSIDDDVVKYGISSDPIGKDGLSDRLRRQLGLFNAIVDGQDSTVKSLLKELKAERKLKR